MEAPSPDEAGEAVSIGLMGDGRRELAAALAHHPADLTLSRLEGSPDVFDLATLDCLVIEAPEEESVLHYRSIREIHPNQPIVFIDFEGQLGSDFRVVVETDEYATIISTTANGVPTSLVVATCRRLSSRPRTGWRGLSSTESVLYLARSREFYALWILAGLTYGVGDLVSTVVTVELTPDVEEVNPVIRFVLETVGLTGFTAVKLVILLGMLAISVSAARRNDRLGYYLPPTLLILAGTMLTVWNVATFVMN